MHWDVIDLGRMAYGPALERQRDRNLAVSRGEARPALLLLEHEPVITLSNRQNVRDHLLADAATLDRLGITLAPTDRGGDITYHGPGQLIAYPILPLQVFGLNLGRYMRLLEAAVIETVAALGVRGDTQPPATGVWVAGARRDAPPAKLCAMGVRVRKNTTMHGLALNVSTDLSHFATIDPCGLGGRPVTSLAQQLGAACPTMRTVKATLSDVLAARLAVSQDQTRHFLT